MNVLVTGGAGYIGSHAVKRLHEAGHQVVALDSLARGHRQAVPRGVPFEELDLRHAEAIASALNYHKIDAVMHFAALAYVGESVEQPLDYYDNNTYGTICLLRAMQQAGTRRLVFSSTCATYGEPQRVPMDESTPQQPINPYGRSKLFVEKIIQDHAATDPKFAAVNLRYFNVAGCAADGSLGEDHDPETHLIPVLLQCALGQRDKVTIHGDDYDTPDGTCIRDYIHVEDLVDAHILALSHLADGQVQAYNMGIGKGYSVQSVIDAARRVTGEPIPAEVGPRRPGDPPQLYADSSKIQRELGWTPRYTELEPIIETAWRWFHTHPDGYEQP